MKKEDIIMEGLFIEKTIQTAIYKRKEGTAGSYYWQCGSQILPNRISVCNVQFTAIRNKGRNLIDNPAGQLRGEYTRKETSPLKLHKPYHLQTTIYKKAEFPLLFGYGTIGISDISGKITKQSDKGDIVVLFQNTPEEFTIFFLPSAIGSLNEVLSFIQEKIETSN